MPEICPYSGLSATIFNDEHIFPHALGGGLDYKLRVSKSANEQFGDSIDVALIDSPLIQAVRTELGIRSRSGEPSWRLHGIVKGTDIKVEVTFRRGQDPILRVENPVSRDLGDPNVGLISCSQEDFDGFLQKFIKNHERKGNLVELGPESSLINEPIEFDLSVDLSVIKRALAKIAFASLVHYLPQYLQDPLVPEWRKLMSGSDAEAKQAKVYGTAFDADQLLPMLFPRLEPYEHAVTVAVLEKPRILVAVTLFGMNFHHIVAVASERETYGLSSLEGRIAVCDARNRSTRFIDYTDAFRQKLLAVYEK